MAVRYKTVGRAVVERALLPPGNHDDYYVFTANREVHCTHCGVAILPGVRFTRREWRQATERFSRYPECATCRPFALEASAQETTMSEAVERDQDSSDDA